MAKTGNIIHSIFNKKLPIYWVAILGIIIFFAISTFIGKVKSGEIQIPTKAISCLSPIHVTRENDYKLVHPIMLADTKGDDKKYNPLKEKITQYIESEKKSSSLNSASVYFNALNDNTHFSVNHDEKYDPADLMEITTMIALLKQHEKDPFLLDKKILYGRSSQGNKWNSNIVLDDGKSYSIRDLIYNMIANSDENASKALDPYVDKSVWKSIYSALNEKCPDPIAKDYSINPCHYSKFLKTLYISGYLSNDDSEYALNVLTNSSFKNGIVKGTDQKIKVAHHFSESESGNSKQLHEFGIVYLNNKPYLLGIMMKYSRGILLAL